jgi:hypothetical protein
MKVGSCVGVREIGRVRMGEDSCVR